jgi:hypothetical protein
MSPVIADAQVREYLDAVRARLGDLDAEEREHLLSDTEASLLEAAEEHVAVPLEVRLGPPDHFARELRAAAGLPELPAPAEGPGLLTRLAAHRAVRAAGELARELAPAWWVARGFVAFTVVAQLLGDDWSIRYPVFTSLLGEPLGWVLLLGAISGSVLLGRRARATTGRWPLVLNIALWLAAAWLVVAMASHSGAGVTKVVYVELSQPGLRRDGAPIDNLYPYDRHGRLLQDVRLYDGSGMPIEVRRGEGRPRRVLVDRSGESLFNSFPIRYFEQGTRRVRRPEAGGLSERPRPIATPRVRPRQR